MKTFSAFLALLALTFGQPSLACSSCGCSLSTDWSTQGPASKNGFSLDLRYDYLNQNDLRHAASGITPTQANAISPSAEIEDYTKNQYVTLGLGYTSKNHWSVQLMLPYLIRQHQTFGNGGSPSDPGNGYYSAYSQVGDAKLLLNLPIVPGSHNVGLTLGLKLPTGNHDQYQSYPAPFHASPLPQLIDASLQPGTGTTDLVAGLYYFDALNRDWDYFVQGLYQTAVLGPMDSYRPGDGANLNLGLRYMSYDNVFPQLQINARHVNRDSGTLGDTVSTGGTLVYLSPGVSVRTTDRVNIYGFIQLPLYQNVIGYQLTPRYTASLGVNYAF